MMMDFKPRKTSPSLFYCIALFVFNWAGFALLMLFLGVMVLDGAILATRLIKVAL
jgi:hypothetical protein